MITVEIKAVDPTDLKAVAFAAQVNEEIRSRYRHLLRPNPKTLSLDDERPTIWYGGVLLSMEPKPGTAPIIEQQKCGWDAVIAADIAKHAAP